LIGLSADLPLEVLPNGVRALGIELYPKGERARHREVVEAVKQSNPSHLIVMTPSMPLISWGIRAEIPVLPMFADSFLKSGLSVEVRNRLLAFLLNAPSIELVANHGLAAALDLKRIGVDPRKIVPWDLPPHISPRDYEPKAAPPGNRPFRLIYVGAVVESKGVGDAIRAVSKLRKQGKQIELTIIGLGDIERFKELAITEQIQKDVFFAGRKSHPDVLAAMRDHDAVVVPTRWEYSESGPMTLYEALCTRTPVLASDHPVMALKLRDRYNALVFPERSPEALAVLIDELASSPNLYTELSRAAEDGAKGFMCPLDRNRLISDFLTSAARIRLRDYSLANYDYVKKDS
jgi:glycosyltransferase involved in cell wall biosynthesis